MARWSIPRPIWSPRSTPSSRARVCRRSPMMPRAIWRSEEHTSELQSHRDLHSFPTRRSSDLDGTLVDTAPDLVATLNAIFAREGLPPVAYDAARNMVGGGARLMIERGLRAEGRKLAASEIDRLVRDFVDHYAAHIADQSRPFPGLTAALDE